MTEAILSGLLLGLALVFSVGPVIFAIIRLRINEGIKAAFFFIVGVWLSDLIWVFTANLFSSFLLILQQYAVQVGTAGGLFLIGMGINNMFFKKYTSKQELDNGLTIIKTTNLKLFLTGFTINTLNPGVITLWLAAATQAINSTLTQKITTFTICLSMNMIADVFKINLAGKLRNKLTDKNIVIINKIAGLLFFIFGIVLIAKVWLVKK